MINLTPQQLRHAADIQEKIQALEAELNQILGGTVEAAPTETPAKKRKMSAAGRAAIAAAAKARWAKYRAVKSGKPGRKKLSAAEKARLSALAKARWAKAKKAGRSRL
jgi:hypothetical protein